MKSFIKLLIGIMSECSNVLAEFLMKLSCDGSATSMSTNCYGIGY